jgi:hypothetical protein
MVALRQWYFVFFQAKLLPVIYTTIETSNPNKLSALDHLLSRQ